MAVERSRVCSTCDHRELEHAVGIQGPCHKWGCRCTAFTDSGKRRVVMPMPQAGRRR